MLTEGTPRNHEFEANPELSHIHEILSKEGLTSKETAVTLYAGLKGARKAFSFWGKSPEEMQVSYKIQDGYTPVTLADTGSEEEMAGVFHTYFPGYSIYGEDTERKQGLDDRNTVAMDGVDGSLTFARGDYTWATALAICRKDDVTNEKYPITSAIILPSLGLAVVAEKNKGTVWLKLNAETLQIEGEAKKCSVSKPQANTSKPLMYDLIISPDAISIEESNGLEKEDFLAELTRKAGKINQRAGGSNSHSGAFVAMGIFDATIMDCIGGVFDALPSALAITEAGGRYTDEDGNDLSLEHTEKIHLTIGSNGAYHDKLTEIARNTYGHYQGWRTKRQ